MIVSNSNNLLNILLPNNNNALKEVLKNADSKTLEGLAKGTTTVGDILQNLFEDLKSGEKNKASLENILKNSNIFKDFGSFSKSIDKLLEQMDSSLDKYKPILQNFSKNITELDNNLLKEMINRSGIFLESKILEQTKGDINSLLPKNLENILNQIKAIIKDIPTLDAKNISSFIDKIIQNSSNSNLSANSLTNDLKILVTQLQNLSNGLSDKQLSNLNSLTNLLKSISNSGQLLESKLDNLTLQNQKIASQTVQSSGNIQNSTIPNTTSQNTNIQNPIMPNQQLASTQVEQVINSQTIMQDKANLLNRTIDTLLQLKSEILANSTLPNKETILKQIDTLFQMNDLFKNNSQVEVKAALSQLTQLNDLKLIAKQNPAVENLLNSIKNQVDSIGNLESKLLQNENIQVLKQELTNSIQQTLFSLKSELTGLTIQNSNLINQIIDKIFNIQNLFSKIDIPVDLGLMQNKTLTNSFQNNFANNLNSLILNLKESIITLSSSQENLHLQTTIHKNIDRLEHIAHNLINNMHTDKAQIQNSLQNDMKSVLLQMQAELQAKADSGSNSDTLKQIDKIVSQIEYHQLLSLVSNSNSVYIPFFWDMLEEGNISMKKIDEDKFYCEINLSLKEFGKTQLLLALYDKNKLDLTVYISQESFKQAFRENSIKLKQALNSADLIPVNINIIDMKKDKEESSVKKQTDIYSQNQGLNMGVDIRA